MRGSRSASPSSRQPLLLIVAMQFDLIINPLNFIMALLQSQMTRYHEDTRPRYSNPTYASTNIGSTLGMYLPYIHRSITHQQAPAKPTSRDAKSVSKDDAAQTSPMLAHRRSSSQLSNVGSSSLKTLNRYISDREVYEKQQKNYNIISVQPKEYLDTIKVFPKYHLEDQDHNYFRKMQIEKDLTAKLNLNRATQRQVQEPKREQKQKRTFNPEQAPRTVPMRGKYLNHVDEVGDII